MRAKSAVVNIRVHPDTKAMWDAAADILGISVTEMVEDAVNPVAAKAFVKARTAHSDEKVASTRT